MSDSKLNLSENTSGLRTPESIVRFHESESLKRGVTVEDDTSIKRQRIARYDVSHNKLGTRGSFYSNEMPGKHDRSHWDSNFPSRPMEVFDQDLERPNTAHPGTYPRLFENHATPSHFLPSGAILSPSTTPFTRKETYLSSSTPTRSEKASNSAGEISNYRFVPFANDARLTNMPPLPSSASALAAAVASTPTMHSQGIENRIHFSEKEIAYAQNMTSPKKIVIPPPEEMPEVEDDGKKPIYSYAMLIGMAILRAPGRKLTLSQIYAWIMNTFEYYRTSKPTWHNSIRHNLSLNKAFEKKVRPKGDPGKGNYWVIVKDFEYQFLRPRSPKRGPDNSLTPVSSFSSDITSKAQVAIDQPQSLKMSYNETATLPVDRCADLPAGQTHAVHQGFQRSENLPSDGTEPDDCLLEEEQAGEIRSLEPSDANFSSQTELKTGQSSCETSSHLEFDLPQMRAMSSNSISRPHSPAVSFNKDEPAPVKSAACKPSTANLDNSCNKPKPRISCLEEANEWRGQGHFAFRCSTPSLIRPQYDNCDPAGISTALAERYAKPATYLNFELQENFDPNRATAVKENANNFVPRLRSAPTPNYQEGHVNVPDIELKPPRTPEKTPKQTQGFAPNQFHKPGSSIWSSVSLAPPKSFESPFAGTIDLSPGSSFLFDTHGTERGQQSQPLQVHRAKKASPNHFSDFLELDFRKADYHSGHKRTPSASSDETSNAPSDHAHNSSVLGNVTGSAGTAGPASSWNSFSMSLDVDISPRLVMTPIRRPFDTPIRDQSHTYSPYCHGASSSFGSPLRRA